MSCKKFLSAVLAITMMLTTISIGVFAESPDTLVSMGGTVTVNGSETTYSSLTEAAKAEATVPEDGVIIYTINGAVEYETGTELAKNEAETVIITGNRDDTEDSVTLTKNYHLGITATNASLKISGITINDRSDISNAENALTAWEFAYIGFDGTSNITLDTVKFTEGLMIWDDENATIKNCVFDVKINSIYSLWIGSEGKVTVDESTFDGFRGIKTHAAYNDDADNIVDVTVTNCEFTNLTEKPAFVLTNSNGGTIVSANNTISEESTKKAMYVAEGNETLKADDAIAYIINDEGKKQYYTTTKAAQEAIDNGEALETEATVATSSVKVNDDNVEYYCATLADAVAAATEEDVTITLLSDIEGGLNLGANDPEQVTTITIDLNRKTWYAGEPTVGSTGTKTNAIRVLAGGKVTIKNGTINLDNEAGTCKVGIANYDTLTLEDVTIDTGENENLLYTINNRGTLVLEGNTTVPSATDPDGPQIAITNDPYDYYYTNQNATLTVNDENVVVGDILLETYGNDINAGVPELNISAGTFGDIKDDITDDYGNAIGVKVTITGGTFNSATINTTQSSTISVSGTASFKELNIKESENVNVEISDDVTIMPEDAVVIIGNIGYSSLDKAIDVAESGSTLTLERDATIESTDDTITDTLRQKNIKIDLNGYSLTASKAIDPRDYIYTKSGYAVKRTASDNDYVYTVVRTSTNKPSVSTNNNNNNGNYTGGTSYNPDNDTENNTTVTLPFVDVTDGDWFYEYVEYAYENELMNGMSETEFAPNTAMSRAMLVTILYRLAGSPEVVTTETEWYSTGQAWAMEKAISDGTNMTDEITREQLAAMLYRYAGMIGADTAASGDITIFTDAESVSEYATDAVAWAVANELVNGMGNGTFAPQSSATRAQVAAIFTRAADLLK